MSDTYESDEKVGQQAANPINESIQVTIEALHPAKFLQNLTKILMPWTVEAEDWVEVTAASFYVASLCYILIVVFWIVSYGLFIFTPIIYGFWFIAQTWFVAFVQAINQPMITLITALVLAGYTCWSLYTAIWIIAGSVYFDFWTILFFVFYAVVAYVQIAVTVGGYKSYILNPLPSSTGAATTSDEKQTLTSAETGDSAGYQATSEETAEETV
jgi:hypothetical protein